MSHADYVDVQKWQLIKLTHWTLDYVDSLSFGQLQKLMQIEDGLNKSRG
jgi:hypothetical protein